MLKPVSAERSLIKAADDLKSLFRTAPSAFRFGRSGRFGVPDRGIWMDYWADKNGEKHWFEFGLLRGNEPTKRVVQINMPFSGTREGFTGQLVQDGAKRWLLHWGYLKAKPKAIKTDMFDRAFDLGTKRENVQLSSKVSREYYKVACLDDENFLDDIEDYIKACARVRRYWEDIEAGAEGKTNHSLFQAKLPKRYEIPARDPRTVDPVHDVVVNALAEELTIIGLSPSDERQMRRGPDLFYGDEGKAIGLFEVKTEVTPYSIYTAIGQLFFYKALLSSPGVLVVVLPGDPTPLDREVLHQLGIRLLRYSIDDGTVCFVDKVAEIVGVSKA
ncbi:hypothetical protein [Azospirillum sp.]|uniref:hypothetical protein n=1 Tax=Azospirillum sp. TaxID=34012 RepID=UPI002D327B67|nr:hypothetical protein [Azospirillum sp.]HYF87403.1 hypothetical protein [Azospirillum sp.]